MRLPQSTLLALLPFFLESAHGQASGTGKTTRYWDCCKPSCAWPKKASLVGNPVQTCDKNDNPLNDGGNTASACTNGGSAYMCSSGSPWAVNETTAYGWAAVNIAGEQESNWCCACYALTFTSGPAQGKTLVVQATNTGSDLGSNQFDLAIPGGGVGQFNACSDEWGAPPEGWGQQYGGVSSRSACDSFPEKLKAGCYFRFDWMEGADNPSVSFQQVACPAAITAKSGCVRQNDVINESPVGPSSVSTWTSSATPTSS